MVLAILSVQTTAAGPAGTPLRKRRGGDKSSCCI